ncbi:hypothetical protein AM571_CH01459 [Rhizobium etli 8C-3]|uniref:Uncharacterized protein n=1 Tax=Rhizobium etli 8C-3 TaxID=538025 RepID=A0A1L5P2A8_RHIET|nr:hypothetical protein [Rhizobium etli]APO74294.1 hypothetical protein AM571_CH01459 [Rhizobium etli 8C-3]
MTNNELITLVLSTASFAVSLFIAGWTVFRDAIQKPKFRVTISIKKVFMPDGIKTIGPDIFVEALNLGPSPNRAVAVFARPSWLNRKLGKRSAYIHPDYTHIANNVPKERIEVGNGATFVFPLSTNTFLDAGFSQVGVSDGFGKIHWADRKEMLKAAEQAKKHRGSAAN